jgi:Transcriptional regulator/sugar kinase
MQILRAIAGKEARTRAELARYLKLAPSTVSARVQELLANGELIEVGISSSQGGRPPTVLRTAQEAFRYLVVSLGSVHVRLGIVLGSGEIEGVEEHPVDVRNSPEETLQNLTPLLQSLMESTNERGGVQAVCVAVPGPVDVKAQSIVHPSRLPGWNNFPVAKWLNEQLKVPVVAENDANLMALGEHIQHPELASTITVKAGTGIGAGMIIDGKCYRGATGMGGDLSHARLPGAPDIPCACGNTGCLEAIASGQALVDQMRQQGHAVTGVSDIVAMATDAEPSATLAVREAGRTLGLMLCPIAEFTNPEAIFLGGQLSTLEAYVASVRSQLYDGCHPLVTRDLVIAPTTAGPDAILIGAAHLLMGEYFHMITL